MGFVERMTASIPGAHPRIQSGVESPNHAIHSATYIANVLFKEEGKV
jgi:hypothetical protein